MSVIDDYLATVPAQQQQQALAHVRAVALRVAPECQETIGYGMPVLKYKGKYLVGFSAFKHHLSIFPGPEAIDAVRGQLGKYKLAKGTIQFSPETPLPDTILEAIVLHRKASIDAGGA